MFDIYSRVSVLASEVIQDQEKLDKFLAKFSLIIKDYSITEMTKEVVLYDNADEEACKMFLGVKAVEGRAEGTLYNYEMSLRALKRIIQKSILKATPNDIRCVLAYGIGRLGWKQINADNYRRYWSSFYTWACNEDLIEKNPMRQVKPIKGIRKVRMPFTEEEMERIRDATETVRERALIEFLFSTACRVSEVTSLKLTDCDFTEKTAKVLGKGRKERIVFLNSKALLYLKKYLETRTDNCNSLFINEGYQHRKRPIGIKNSGIELIIRNVGKRAGIENVHPHRFRHTAATYALRRGMPVEQVQQMLGHEKVDTTLIYAKVDKESLKMNHYKYLN